MILVFLSGCRVVDAPESIEELVAYGFVHFDDDDAYLEAVSERIPGEVETNFDALTEGLRVDALSSADIEAVGVTPDAEVSIVGVAAVTELELELPELACVLTWPDLTAVIPGTVAWDVVSGGDRTCFLDGGCETFEVLVDRTRDLGLLGEATQRVTRQFRWVEGDGGTSLVLRELIPEPADITTELYAIDQQYAWSIAYAGGPGLRRIETYWVDARAIGVELPDSLLLDMTVSAIQDNAEAVEAFEPCDG